MLPLLIVGICICNLGTLALLWHFGLRVNRALADVWQAVAELRMHHNALDTATRETFADVGEALAAALDEPVDIVNVTPPPACQCPNCRKRRQLEVN